ncbi:hypothetical protein SEA_ABBA_12 [Arthrobacter phage Abba]|uniref:Tail terminator n=1 Tax=Arthrobacter phage Abba TaxID=2713256 RepID=A0A6G8R2E9_9CAUD|nr:hypothetical protein HYQ28_gp12 [Arthrobacter phage Abba]QIN94341.1 hypothetical protein SEA_ABBA_12 [Arthrobacter phage Abba]
MLGAEGISRALFRRVRDSMPGRLAMLRARYGATIHQLPDLATLEPDEVDVASIEKFPLVFVFLPDTTGKLDSRQTDMTAGYDEYSYRYNVQLYAYVVGDDYKATSLQMKRYVLALRETMLADKQIIPEDDAGDYAEIDPSTVRESYSQVGQGVSKKLIAGAFLEFQIVSHERIVSIFPETPIDHYETNLNVTQATGSGIEIGLLP